MINKKSILLIPGLIAGAMVLAADSAAVRGDEVRAGTFENVGRQELFFRSTELVNRANKLMVEGKFRDAIKYYRQAVEVMKPVGGGTVFKDKIEFCQKRISDCYFNMAEDSMRRADELATSFDFEEAIKLCKEALEFCSERREELESRIEFYEKRRIAAIGREETAIDKLSPELSAQEYQIQLLIEQGLKLAKRNELMAARRKFEEVLLIDPYNAVAVQNLLGISTKIRNAATPRANATAVHQEGYIQWSGTIPIAKDFIIINDNAAVDPSVPTPEAPVAKAADTEMEKRLKEIVFPNYSLISNYMTFDEALEDLQRQAEEFDPQQRGVNFVIRNVKNANPKAAPKLAGYTPGKAISLYEILSQLQERGDLTFKIDDNAVIIAAKGVPLEKMVVRAFNFPLAPTDTETDIKNSMKAAAQVTFDAGSSLTLVPERNEIISRNTPINQQRIASWLALNEERGAQMVQIMFKFLEVSQNDLDELGFNWQYARTGRKASFTSSSNALLRHYANGDGNDRFGGASVGGNTEDATYNFHWNDGKNDLTASVYALDWADSSDILYSPRVTTLDKTTAHVNMSEIHHYPDEYGDSESESSPTWRGEIYIPQPEFGDEESLGINFKIRPEVQPNNLIRAQVNFTIKQFDQWMIIDSRSGEDDDDDNNNNNDNDSDSDSDSDDSEYQKKPIFTVRTINTDVTLKDGETVLIGSISQDQVTAIHDKVPILGDIPFIGRFFQSRYSMSKKNNLLVFMTCRLVDPDGSATVKDTATGRPQNTGYQTGLPAFPRNQ